MRFAVVDAVAACFGTADGADEGEEEAAAAKDAVADGDVTGPP